MGEEPTKVIGDTASVPNEKKEQTNRLLLPFKQGSPMPDIILHHTDD